MEYLCFKKKNKKKSIAVNSKISTILQSFACNSNNIKLMGSYHSKVHHKKWNLRCHWSNTAINTTIVALNMTQRFLVSLFFYFLVQFKNEIKFLTNVMGCTLHMHCNKIIFYIHCCWGFVIVVWVEQTKVLGGYLGLDFMHRCYDLSLKTQMLALKLILVEWTTR